VALAAGTRLGVYEIVALLGAGGMGEVYRATDTRLARQVAIKVLPEVLANDPPYMARFEREAQVLASLSHTNIATVYGIEGSALVMEMVEGPTLEERIAAGPLPLDDALAIARQIADGLEAAHERGIVHRDLKPANVKITAGGVVKLLDFGLAKAVEARSAASGPPAMSPTLSLAMTQAGLILGTASYMAPEQARGKPVDRRADIWAFGVVLNEMLTGRQLFGGETVTDTLAAVVTKNPDLDLLPAETPPHIRRLLERCLRKDPKTRLRDIGEARVLIDEPFAPEAAPATTAEKLRRHWIPWALAGVLGVGLAVAAGIAWRATRPAPPRPLMRLTVDVGQGTELATAGQAGHTFAITQDGTRMVIVIKGPSGAPLLGTRLLRQSQVTPLSGTEGAQTPFFSHDGQWIGFWADGRLKKVAVEGGAPMTLCESASLRGASWGDDGNIIAALSPTSALVRIPAGGGKPEPVTQIKTGERTHRWPQVLPGSKAVLFTAHGSSAAYDEANIDVVTLATGERKTVQRGGFSPRYLASGHLLYAHQSTLFAAPFDPVRLTMTGAPVPVVEDAAGNGSAGSFSAVSETGTLVYRTGLSNMTGWSVHWLEGKGAPTVLHSQPGTYLLPSFSPDGKRLALTIAGSQGEDIWVKDLERGTLSRLTFLAGRNREACWTPDGTGIVFRSTNPDKPGMYWIRSDGSGEAERLTESPAIPFPSSFSPDGKRLAFANTGSDGTPDIFTATFGGDPAHPRLGKPELFLGTRFVEIGARFSPDGRWIAYQSMESSRFEVYVRPFPGPGGRWQISTAGGEGPRWSRTGRELLFQAPDVTLMAVSYTVQGETFSAGQPRVWSQSRPLSGPGVMWDLAPDGKRVAIMLGSQENVGQKPVTQLTMLLGFFDEVRRRVGRAE
jgi:hypothetical protein